MRICAVLLGAGLACAPALPAPLVRVVSTAPQGSVPAGRVTVEIAFSGPLDPRGIEDARFFALCRREDLREVAQLAEKEEGIPAGAPVVPSHAQLLDGGRRAVLTPDQPLEPGGAWGAVLSRLARSAEGRPVLDADGRSHTIAVEFETGPAADVVPPHPSWLLPPHGPVPSNLIALRVKFDEPVEGALALAAPAPAARPAPPAPDVLGLQLEGPLAPGALEVRLGGVQDHAGNEAAPLAAIAVSPCRSEAAPPVAQLRAVSGELSVTAEASLGGMGRLGVEATAGPGEPGCGAVPAAPAVLQVLGDVGPCPGWDPCQPGGSACSAQVVVAGLCPGRAVRLRAFSEDLAGHRSEPGSWMEAAALPPRPAPVLTEALADADSPEAGGEYVEVTNLGTGDADLAGHVLAKRNASGTTARCTLAPMAGGPIPPGGYALAVGGAYDARYALPPGTALYRCGTTALAGGLANARAVALALEDGSGQVVSTMGIDEAAPRCSQGALERIQPAGPDAVSNWACPGTRTPGACNRSTPPESCPKRPW